MPDRAQLDEWQGLCDFATPGPWVAERRDGYITGHITAERHDYAGNSHPNTRPESVTSPDTMTADDADFIAAARLGWPACIAALRTWLPMTTAEAEAALEEAVPVPISDEEISRIVEQVTDPTYHPTEPQHIQMAAKIAQLQRQLDGMRSALQRCHDEMKAESMRRQAYAMPLAFEHLAWDVTLEIAQAALGPRTDGCEVP